MVFLLGLAAFAATYIGGTLALRLHLNDKLHLIAGFSAGAVIGVAFFDLLPESTNILAGHGGITLVSTLIAIGFALYLILDRLVLHHAHDEEERAEHTHHGVLGAASFTIHSIFDGLAIGFAFQVSPTVGWIVAVAVLAHDFSDGINTVNIMLRHGGGAKRARTWLLADAAAPLIGVTIAYFVAVSHDVLGGLLGLMCGIFLYIGASDLLPESHHAHSKRLTTILTLAGIALLYIVIRLAA